MDSKKKLGDLLVERGLITTEQLQEALARQATEKLRLGELLVKSGTITEGQLVEAVADRLSIPRLSLKSMVLDTTVVQRIPVSTARRYDLIPVFEIADSITLAMADPLNIIALDEVKYHTGLNVKRAIAPASEIKEAIETYYSVADSIDGIIGDVAAADDQIDKHVSIESDRSSESPIVKMVDLIISRAVKEKASDIHIEPEETRVRIRYRINGVMREEASPPKSMQNELVSRIKVAASMDISEKLLPQDGRFEVVVDNNPIDFRVSTLPTIHGEKLAIRILDRRNLFLRFDQLGFAPLMEAQWHKMVNQPEGLILITGPTSSGKTSTMYTTLQAIDSVERNVVTVEDPVEYSLPSITQIQTNEKSGLTFASCLRSILRQNPDIIMIGEIRDLETAQMAVRSALTGHQVYSTIHTNDAPSAIVRLTDMGLENYMVASSLKGVLAQRLVRVNCPDCLESYHPAESILTWSGLAEQAEEIEFRKGFGCSRCRQSGYIGQTGLFEFVEIDSTLMEMILTGQSLNKIKNHARKNGYVPLFEAGLQMVRRGTICLEELLRQTARTEPVAPDQANTKARSTDAYSV